VQRRSFGAAVASGAGTLVGAPRWSWSEVMSAPPKASPDASRILPADCDQAVSHLVDKASGREIYLIGTAHISNVSAALVDTTIRAVKPSLIAVELDASRLRGLADSTQPIYSYSGRLVSGSADSSLPSSQENNEPLPSMKPERKGFLGQLKSRFGVKMEDLGPAVIGKALQQMYRSMDEAGFQSGNEFKLAIEGAARLQVNHSYCDESLLKTWSSLPMWLQSLLCYWAESLWRSAQESNFYF